MSKYPLNMKLIKIVVVIDNVNVIKIRIIYTKKEKELFVNIQNII